MSRPWLRLYSEFATDPKVQLLAFDDQRHYVCLLCLKCNGTLDSGVPSGEFRNRMIAKALGLDMVSALEARRRLVDVGLIGDDWQPTRWDQRQYESDHCDPTAAERMRRHRERKKSSVTAVTRNVTAPDQTQTRQEKNQRGAREPAQPTGAARAPELDRAGAAGRLSQILERTAGEGVTRG